MPNLDAKSRGKFITFEGGEGGGKSSQLKRLSAYLTEKGIDHIVTREPGGSDFAEKIRDLILSSDKDEIDPLTEYLLFSAARRHHVKSIIEPALFTGKWVLSDRFYDSSVVYQGLSPEPINQVDLGYMAATYDRVISVKREDGSINKVAPDMTLIFDIDVRVGLTRAKKVTAESTNNNSASDHFESKSVIFHQKVRDGFLEHYQNNKDRCRLIDASLDLDAVFSQVQKNIEVIFS